MDVESPRLQADTNTDVAIGDRLVCVSPDKTITKVLKQETRSGGRKYGCLQPGLVQSEELCQPSMVLDSSLVESDKAAKGQSSYDHTTQLWYLTILEMLENYPHLFPAIPNLVILPTVQDTFIMKQGVLELVAWPISGNPLHHEGFLQKLQISSCPPREQRPSSTTTRTVYQMDGMVSPKG